MREYLVDQLIASAKRRGRIPDNAFSAADWLSLAHEEMETYLAPLIVRAQEDYYETDAYYSMTALEADGGALLDLVLDAPLYELVPWTGTQMTFRIPPRAAGGALRNLSFLDQAGNTIGVPRISIDDLEQATWGFVLQGQSVTYVNRIASSAPVAVRFTFAMKPSLFCQAAAAATITDIVGRAVTLAAIASPPNPLLPAPSPAAPTSFASVSAFDVMKATPGFEVVAFDRSATWSGGVLTFDADLPRAVEIGDYVAPAHYTPVPPCPTALWALLAQATTATALEQLGQMEQANQAIARRELIAKQVLPLLQNRVKGSPQSIMRRHGILSSTKRW